MYAVCIQSINGGAAFRLQEFPASLRENIFTTQELNLSTVSIKPLTLLSLVLF